MPTIALQNDVLSWWLTGSDRQAQIIKMFVDNPKEVITVKDLQSKFFISATTAKGDIMGLVDRGLVNEFAFNIISTPLSLRAMSVCSILTSLVILAKSIC